MLKATLLRQSLVESTARHHTYTVSVTDIF